MTNDKNDIKIRDDQDHGLTPLKYCGEYFPRSMASRKVEKRMRNCQRRVSLASGAERSLNEQQAAHEQRSRARHERQTPMSRGEGQR